MLKRSIVLAILWSAVFSGLVLAGAENISNSSSVSRDVSVAINSSGEIGAIWIENQSLFFSICRNGEWSTPADIPGQSGSNAYPCIAKGVNGGFVAAWHDLRNDCIRFSQYQGSWSTPMTVSQVGGYQLGWPAITTTSNGRIAVGWMRGNPTNLDIYVTIFHNGWSTPENVSDTPFSSKYCDLASGPNGEVYVVFQDNLWINETDYFATMICNDRGNGRWTQPEIIDNLNAWTFRPVVAVNSRNDILSCFYFLQGSSYFSVSRVNGEWQDPQAISDMGDHHDHDLYFSDACPYGNDGFLYIYRDVGYNVVYTVVRNGSIGDAVPLTSSYDSYHPAIDYSSSVGAVAAWCENGEVFASIFDPQDTTPPNPPSDPNAKPLPPLGVEADYRNVTLVALNLNTELIVNRNLFTVQYYRRLTWEFDSSWTSWNIALAKYRIYRKPKTAASWEFLAEVDPSVLAYIDTNGVSAEDRFDYQVRGVDNFGNDYYAYNRLRWAPNPVNADKKITVQTYNIYRKLSGESFESYALWQAVDAATNSLEDHSDEIRRQTQYDYAVTVVSNKAKESDKAEAYKITGAAIRARKR
ncbi:MAG: sialidase family protein [Acidobacteriota bacterium]|jgi:hypothetical protein|nr:sialidase family protein [Acidobacteriota bacterium]